MLHNLHCYYLQTYTQQH